MSRYFTFVNKFIRQILLLLVKEHGENRLLLLLLLLWSDIEKRLRFIYTAFVYFLKRVHN